MTSSVKLKNHLYVEIPTYSSCRVFRMKLNEACDSLKLECALRELGFVDIKWRCVANAGIFFVQPVGFPDDPDGDLLGFQISHAKKIVKLSESAKKALDFAISMS